MPPTIRQLPKIANGGVVLALLIGSFEADRRRVRVAEDEVADVEVGVASRLFGVADVKMHVAVRRIDEDEGESRLCWLTLLEAVDVLLTGGEIQFGVKPPIEDDGGDGPGSFLDHRDIIFGEIGEDDVAGFRHISLHPADFEEDGGGVGSSFANGLIDVEAGGPHFEGLACDGVGVDACSPGM